MKKKTTLPDFSNRAAIIISNFNFWKHLLRTLQQLLHLLLRQQQNPADYRKQVIEFLQKMQQC